MNQLAIRRRLKIDFTWVLAGNVLYSACQWMIVVALAKLGSAAQVGEYALGLALSAPIILFANLQLRSLLASDVTERFNFGQYLSFRLVSLGAALVVVGAIATATEGPGGRAAIVLLVGMAQAIELISETYYGFMQKHGRMDRISRSLMLRGPLSLAALALAMYFTRSVVWALVALALGRLGVLVGWDARLGFSGGKSLTRLSGNLGDMLVLLRTALPLGVISMLVSLNANIPRFFVQIHGGSAELGIFTAVASLLSAGSLVVSAYGQAMFFPVARACAQLDCGEFRRFVLLAAVLGAALGVVAVGASALFGRAILVHLFRFEYGEHAAILVRLMVAGTAMFIASGLGFVVTAARCLRPQVPLLLVTGFVAATACARLIPKYGLSGATDAVLAAALVQLAGTAVLLLGIDRRLRNDSVEQSMRSAKQPATLEAEAV
jgi:O-antigen/teichoic acid export membrane protein